MRLDRLIPLPQPLQPSGRREERPPRRQPEASERPAASDAPADDSGEPGGGERPASPDHLDITV
jgi:hypothetical protein